jgi:fructoselysine-6-P-deglycase FrlB-like protein
MSLMLAEIKQQPAALERTLRREGPRIARFASSLSKHRTRLIVLIARGSSDNAALFGRYLLEISTGIPVSLAAPSVHTLYHTKMDVRDALVIGISQSGEGADVNKLMETCYVVAERFSSADFLHGPIAMVERKFPVFLFAPPGKTFPGMKDLLRTLTKLGAERL